MQLPGARLVRRLLDAFRAGPTSVRRASPAVPRVTVGGRVQTLATQGLLRLTVVEPADGLASAEAVVSNWGPGGYRHFGGDSFDFGDDLVLEVGSQTLFRGRVSGLEGRWPAGQAPELAILAEDRLQDLRMTRRTRTFDHASVADAVGRIASDHALAASIDLPGPVHRSLTQLNQSDLAFLRDQVRAAGGLLWLEGATLHTAPSRAAPEVVLRQGEALTEVTVLADLAHQRTKVVVAGWDASAKEAFAATAPSLTAPEGATGAQLLAAGFGERVETVVTSGAERHDEARDLALALAGRRARRFVTARATASGDAALGLHVGMSVGLPDLGPLFSGSYIVMEVRHVYDLDRGLRTELALERAWVGRP